MPESPLTCEFCRHAPGTHLLAVLWQASSSRHSRLRPHVNHLLCEECALRSLPEARQAAQAAYLYELKPTWSSV